MRYSEAGKGARDRYPRRSLNRFRSTALNPMHSTQSMCQLIRLCESERGDYLLGLSGFHCNDLLPKIPSELTGIISKDEVPIFVAAS